MCLHTAIIDMVSAAPALRDVALVTLPPCSGTMSIQSGIKKSLAFNDNVSQPHSEINLQN